MATATLTQSATVRTQFPTAASVELVATSGSIRGQIVELIIGPQGVIVDENKNATEFENVEAVFAGDFLRGKTVKISIARDGSILNVSEPNLTRGEQIAWDALMNATQRAEVSAIRLNSALDELDETLAEMKARRMGASR